MTHAQHVKKFHIDCTFQLQYNKKRIPQTSETLLNTLVANIVISPLLKSCPGEAVTLFMS